MWRGKGVSRTLRDELTHDGEPQNHLLEFFNAVFGGEQGVKVVGDAGPSFGLPLRRLGGGQCSEQSVDERLVGFDAVGLLLFQLIAQRHEFVYFGDDSEVFLR